MVAIVEYAEFIYTSAPTPIASTMHIDQTQITNSAATTTGVCHFENTTDRPSNLNSILSSRTHRMILIISVGLRMVTSFIRMNPVKLRAWAADIMDH